MFSAKYMFRKHLPKIHPESGKIVPLGHSFWRCKSRSAPFPGHIKIQHFFCSAFETPFGVKIESDKSKCSRHPFVGPFLCPAPRHAANQRHGSKGFGAQNSHSESTDKLKLNQVCDAAVHQRDKNRLRPKAFYSRALILFL